MRVRVPPRVLLFGAGWALVVAIAHVDHGIAWPAVIAVIGFCAAIAPLGRRRLNRALQFGFLLAAVAIHCGVNSIFLSMPVTVLPFISQMVVAGLGLAAAFRPTAWQCLRGTVQLACMMTAVSSVSLLSWLALPLLVIALYLQDPESQQRRRSWLEAMTIAVGSAALMASLLASAVILGSHAGNTEGKLSTGYQAAIAFKLIRLGQEEEGMRVFGTALTGTALDLCTSRKFRSALMAGLRDLHQSTGGLEARMLDIVIRYEAYQSYREYLKKYANPAEDGDMVSQLRSCAAELGISGP